MAENKKNLLEETKAKMSLDDLFNQIQEGNLKELALVVKADVQGSVEMCIRDSNKSAKAKTAAKAAAEKKTGKKGKPAGKTDVYKRQGRDL